MSAPPNLKQQQFLSLLMASKAAVHSLILYLFPTLKDANDVIQVAVDLSAPRDDTARRVAQMEARAGSITLTTISSHETNLDPIRLFLRVHLCTSCHIHLRRSRS